MSKHWSDMKKEQSYLSHLITLSPDAVLEFGHIKTEHCLEITHYSTLVKVKTCKTCCIQQLNGQKGLFAKKNLPKNKIIAIWTGCYVSEKEYLHMDTPYMKYVIKFQSDSNKLWYIVPTMHGLCEFCNDGVHNMSNIISNKLVNSEFIQFKYKQFPVVGIHTLTDIQKGAQLFTDYGTKYWKN